MPYIIIQKTAQEGYYYLDNNNKFSPFAEEARQFEIIEDGSIPFLHFNCCQETEILVGDGF
ncbi:hypothetical protein [Gloeothece verrucosa]|uniref:Uncharacterized protein n=1 Tax=Gloeothece verrucosa (strain PCC 7822) TaxID=497965 RepID=E0UNJ8_GLOV7|nr:hypothetical protein [Gloeothece verrucosa]ADN18528.1 hypothetical protein Cyan7822_6883 [Gloeothece verrucosa PCC 7822]